MIPPDFIDEVLSRTDLVEIVEARVGLKKTGQNYSGLCPFHTEKSPSFTVNREKQFYYCFGCQASGSAIKFVMEFDRAGFVETVENLAARVGLVVPRSNTLASTEKQQKRKSIYQILDQSMVFYQQQLRSHSEQHLAVTYLKGRGLSGEIARDFGLGYAPPGWDNLYSSLAKTNHEHQLLLDAGMVIEKTNNQVDAVQKASPNEQQAQKNRTYDRFRDRVMFPIRDLRGRAIAFGGRILGDAKPKYLNSPETPVFHKGRELYGLYEARKRNRKLTQLVVVEGYMDVVALAQHGVNCAVATLGTATTEEHLERLFRMVAKVIFCFDGDQAGRNAAWKALLVALGHMTDGRSARFLFVPDGEDPDSLIRQEGQSKFEWRMDQAQHLPDFFFEKLQAEVDFDSLDGKAHLSQLAMPLIMQIPNGVFRELMLGRLAELTNLSIEKLQTLAGTSVARAKKPSRRDYAAAEPLAGAASETVFKDVLPDEQPWPEYAIDEEVIDDSMDYPADQSSDLANKALALLLRQPELVAMIAEPVYQSLEAVKGCNTLLEVVRTILVEDIRSPVLLLANYQDRIEFTALKQLAEQEQLLGVADLPLEYSNVIEKIQQRAARASRAELRRVLLAKPFSELSEDEKQQLRELIVNKRG
ncbi:MAG: DNA primase [Pseudomonadales bacterium]|nr:DNA primase [Pseudomonadales bacterium]